MKLGATVDYIGLDLFCTPLQLKKALLGPKRFAK